ncbi:MAG TPA: hypothetical protein VNR67_00530 [Solirubrobacterales bacterium]|nr:hypothetical protein [Solirubrobacterales bacterium]
MAAGIWALVAIAAALALGLLIIPVDGEAPAYAMESSLIFRLERALAIAALLILPALVIAPLFAGTLPRKLSKDGIDWEDERADVVGTVEESKQRLDELESAIKNMVGL